MRGHRIIRATVFCCLYLAQFAFAESNLCERPLILFTEDQIKQKAEAEIANVEFPSIISDHVNPIMGALEPVVLRPRDLGHEIELTTARDYATYLYSHRNQRFVFAGYYRETFVPVFDGLVTDVQGNPLFNVSLKYAAVRAEQQERDHLLENLRDRLHFRMERKRTRDLMAWLNAVNGWMRYSEEHFLIRHLDRDLQRGLPLARAFGIGEDSRFPMGRFFTTVVDMRDSGYTFDFVSHPRVLDEIKRMVGDAGHGTASLTLLWDENHVLEF